MTLYRVVESRAFARRSGFCFGGVYSSSERSSSLRRRGTTWARQLLSQGPRSTVNSKAALAVPMGPLSPHPTTDLHSRPIAPVSSSEVSGGKREEAGPQAAGRRPDRVCPCLPPAAPSAFPAVQYLSQPQPQPYAVHGHFQPTQTGEAVPSHGCSPPSRPRFPFPCITHPAHASLPS